VDGRGSHAPVKSSSQSKIELRYSDKVRKRAPLACGMNLGPFCADCWTPPQRAGSYVSSRVCANCCQNLSLGITRPSTLAPPCHLQHGRHIGTANLNLGVPSGSLTPLPVHLRTSGHQLAFTRAIPRPTARQNRSLMAVLAVSPRPLQCCPIRSAAAIR
jgi:hypothetical protein